MLGTTDKGRIHKSDIWMDANLSYFSLGVVKLTWNINHTSTQKLSHILWVKKQSLDVNNVRWFEFSKETNLSKRIQDSSRTNTGPQNSMKNEMHGSKIWKFTTLNLLNPDSIVS